LILVIGGDPAALKYLFAIVAIVAGYPAFAIASIFIAATTLLQIARFWLFRQCSRSGTRQED